MTAENLIVERDGPIARLTLNRPERRNALSKDLLSSLSEVLDAIRTDRSIRVVTIGAAGSVFSAGHDLAEISGMGEAELGELFELCSRTMLALRGLPQPVVARVQGLATAAGCQLAASCDLVVAAESASFATPGVKIGLFCTTPMIPLVRAIPAKAAMEMLLTAVPITARRAHELGLVNRVVPDEELDREVNSLAQSLLSLSPHVLAIGKRAYYELEGLDEATAYSRATSIMIRNSTSEDARRGIDAFLHKESPRWSHEDLGESS